MSSEQKAAEVLRKLVEIANEGRVIMLEEDWGGNTLTICIDKAHTHVGVPDGDFETLIANLHDLLIHQRGLSWVAAPE